jgi:hypothetical protein
MGANAAAMDPAIGVGFLGCECDVDGVCIGRESLEIEGGSVCPAVRRSG